MMRDEFPFCGNQCMGRRNENPLGGGWNADDDDSQEIFMTFHGFLRRME